MLKNLINLFIAFAKVGIFGYGGGPSSIPLVQVEVVDNYKWLTVGEFADLLAMGNALPGPIATKMSAAVGWRVAGWLGMTVATLGMIAPSIVMILALVGLVASLKDWPKLSSVLSGVRAAVIALLIEVAIQTGKGTMDSWKPAVLSLAVLILLIFLDIHPIFVMVGAGIIGYFLL